MPKAPNSSPQLRGSTRRSRGMGRASRSSPSKGRSAERREGPGDAAGNAPRDGAAQKGPVRTCIACREEAGKAELIRFVRVPDGSIAADPTGRRPGRGAYLHAAPECFELARRRRAVERALGAPVPPEVWSQIEP